MLYLVPPGGASIVDAGGENIMFWFLRTQENIFLDAFSKNFDFVPQIFVQQKSGGVIAHSGPLFAQALVLSSSFS